MNEKHPQTKELEYNHIANGIYIGTNQCCQTHFDEKLKKEGIIADISLEEEKIDTPFGVEFYIWIPIKDYSALTKDQLNFGVAVLEKLVSLKKKVYVHCKNGHGRAPTLVAAYFIKQGENLDEAIELIKTKRPSIHLQDVQKEALIEFSKLRMKKIDKQTFSIGGLTALIASLCCVGPLVLIMLGLGTASTALSIGSKKPYFLVFGLIFFAVSLFMFVRYRRKNICEGCSTKEQEHKRIINTVLVAFTTFIVLYALLVYAIVPKLAPIVYKNVRKETNKIVSVENLRYTALAIDGMWCAGCAVAAEDALKRKTGVVDAKVGLKENLEGMGEVIYNPKQIDLEEIIKAVEPYKAKVISDVQTTTLELKNLSK